MDRRITYGLRDRVSGYYLRVYHRDTFHHTDETPQLESGEYANGDRYEVTNPMDLIETMHSDSDRAIASVQRPTWNGVDMDKCIPVVFIREETKDVGGGEPVLVTETVRKVDLPKVFAGRTRSTRDREKTPERILNRTFGNSMRSVWENPRSSLVLANVSEHHIEPGMVLKGTWHLLFAAAVVDIPEDWPEASLDGEWRLVLGSPTPMGELATMDFEADDFEPETATPTL